MPALSFVIVAPGREFEAALESSASVVIRARVERLDELVRIVEKEQPDALLVALDHDPQAVFAALEKVLAPRPMLFFHGPDDSQLILRAMRFGAREYIAPAPDDTKRLLAAVARGAQEIDRSAETQPDSLIAVIGSKGGVGTSFMACQLAVSLSRLGGRTALVDGHLRHGDVALYLDLSPPYTIADLAIRSEPVDSTYLTTVLAKHASGIHVLAAPKNPEDADMVGVDCVERVVDLLRAEFGWVIWDTTRDFDDRSLSVLDRADSILLVTTPDVPAMNHTRMQLEVLERLGHPNDAIRIVVNRAESGALVSARDAEKFLGRRVDAIVPNDFRLSSTCVNEGRTINDLAPRSPLAQAVRELAVLTHSWCDRSPRPPRPGLLDRLRGR